MCLFLQCAQKDTGIKQTTKMAFHRTEIAVQTANFV